MSSFGRRRRWLRLCLAGGLISLVALAVGTAPAYAGTLSGVTWTVSDSQTGQTAVTYSYSFKTATTGTIRRVTMSVPGATGGTAAVETVYGLGAGSVTLAGNTLTYTVSSPVSVAANIPVYLSVSGMTNTMFPGSRTAAVTTYSPTSSVIDSGTSQSVSFGSSSTTAQVSLSRTLTVTNDTPAFAMSLDPTGLSGNPTQPVVLTVLTNASAGYSLAISDTGLSMTSPAFTIADVTSGPGTGVATFPTSGFGVSAVLTGGGTDGAALAAGLAGGKWVGYPLVAANFLTTTGPTGLTADTLTLTNRVSVDYATPAGSYSDTISYVVTPTY